MYSHVESQYTDITIIFSTQIVKTILLLLSATFRLV
jgi:hypothetical protein